MKNKTKILVLGIGQSNFLNQLYGNVIKDNPSVSVDIDGYFDISKDKAGSQNGIYENYYNFKNIRIGKIKLLLVLLRFLFGKFFWRVFFFELSQGSGFTSIKKRMLGLARAGYILKKYILPLNSDLLHFHFCTPDNLVYLHFMPKNIKSICSFWGSDLMRMTGASNVFYMGMALKKATAITIQTQELAEMLYCKYGRQFSEKVTTLPFTISTEIYQNLDSLKGNSGSIREFKEKHGIPLDKVIIAISHNAFPENNHLKITNEIRSLETALKNRIALVLPLGYGGSTAYKNELMSEAEAINDLQIVPLLDYFNPENTALLRHSTDIMIQMPISDALSGAMTEVLYAGNKVIAGSWLPYGVLRRNGIEFIEIDDFKKLPEAIERSVADLGSKTNGNAEKIKSFLFPDSTTPQWNHLFKRILNE